MANKQKVNRADAASYVEPGCETVEIRVEELNACQQPVRTGEVEIRKQVVTEQRTLDVPVTREEVVIERHPVGRRPADAPISSDASERSRVPVMDEEVTLEKRPVVVEEISVGKCAVQETERVSGTVHRERAVVEKAGDAPVTSGHVPCRIDDTRR